MISIDALLPGALAHAVTRAVLHSVWIVAAAALVYALLRRYAGLVPRARYGAGFALLGAAVMAAFGIFIGTLISARTTDPSVLGLAVAGGRAGALTGSGGSVLDGAGIPGGAAIPVPFLVAWAWLVGFAVVAARATVVAATIHAWVDRRAAPLPAAWAARADEIAREIGLDRAVRFLASDACSVPFTFGWLAPVVVLPISALTGLSATSLELVLRHELTHIARRDYLMQLVQCLAEAVLFFHPLTWWLSREIRRDRELACDEAVLAHGANRLAYARALIEIETSRNAWPAPSLGAHGGSLKMRVLTIVSPLPRRSRVSTRFAFLPAALLVAASAFVACDPAAPPGADVASSSSASMAQIDVAWLPDSVERHREEIEAASAAAGVDPDLIALMVLVESGGDPEAVSPTGALGLMQLMPETAGRVAAGVGTPLENDEALFDPALNIRLGALLVGDLLQTEAATSPSEARSIAWATYNGGEAAVRAHLEDGRPLPEETQGYVRLLESLYAERGLEESASYAAWRARLAAKR